MAQEPNPADFDKAGKVSISGSGMSLAEDNTPDQPFYTFRELADRAMLQGLSAPEEEGFLAFLENIQHAKVVRPAVEHPRDKDIPDVSSIIEFFKRHESVTPETDGSALVKMKNGQTIQLKENDITHVGALDGGGKSRAFSADDAYNMALAARNNPNLAPPKQIYINNASKKERELLKAAIQQVSAAYGLNLTVKKNWRDLLSSGFTSATQFVKAKVATPDVKGPEQTVETREAGSGGESAEAPSTDAKDKDRKDNTLKAGSAQADTDAQQGAEAGAIVTPEAVEVTEASSEADVSTEAAASAQEQAPASQEVKPPSEIDPELLSSLETWRTVEPNAIKIPLADGVSEISYLGKTGQVTNENPPREIHSSEIVDGAGKGTLYFYAQNGEKQDVIMTVNPDGQIIRDPNIYIKGDKGHILAQRDGFLAAEKYLNTKEKEIRQSPVVGMTDGRNPAKVYQFTAEGRETLVAFKDKKFRILEVDGKPAKLNANITFTKTPEYLASVAAKTPAPAPEAVTATPPVILQEPTASGKGSAVAAPTAPETKMETKVPPLLLREPVRPAQDLKGDFVFTTRRDKTMTPAETALASTFEHKARINLLPSQEGPAERAATAISESAERAANAVKESAKKAADHIRSRTATQQPSGPA